MRNPIVSKLIKISTPVILILTCVFLIAGKPKNGAKHPDLLQTVHVDQNSSASSPDGSLLRPFSTISEALNAAAPEADIYIAAGNYRENLYIYTPAHLHGTASATLLTAEKGTSGVVNFIASGSIEGFHIMFEGKREEVIDPPSGILIRDPATAVRIANNVIENCMSGIEVNSSAIVTIENNRFTNNYYSVSSVNSPGKVSLSSNQITNSVHGVFCSECNMEINDNTITGNICGIKVATRDESFPFFVTAIQDNRIVGNKSGIWFHQGTKVLNAVIDLGGGGYSKGGNVIAKNELNDIVNQSKGLIYARGNRWFEQKLLDLSGENKIIIQ
jgi:nitrous oxidase accessory protein NosD